jgi:ribosome modulation factor
MTYSHAEAISRIETAIKEGRNAYREGVAVDTNPYDSASGVRSWWTEGWYRESEEK